MTLDLADSAWTTRSLHRQALELSRIELYCTALPYLCLITTKTTTIVALQKRAPYRSMRFRKLSKSAFSLIYFSEIASLSDLAANWAARASSRLLFRSSTMATMSSSAPFWPLASSWVRALTWHQTGD